MENDARMGSPRFIAVDWSGAISSSAQKNKIWIADWKDEKITLKSGISRHHAVEYILNAGREASALVVGLDFSFSYPAWFLDKNGCETVEEFWQLVAEGKGEEWLTKPNDFCWGGKGIRRPEDHAAPDWRGLRETERSLKSLDKGKRFHPKSAFQIGGAGAVGTGTLRGIPYLLQLKRAGFSIWPFDQFRLPALIEIYPRLFTRGVKVSRCAARSAHLSQPRYASLPSEVAAKALDSEDAFDALCSVVAMEAHAEELLTLQQTDNLTKLIEGDIWSPRQS